MSTAQWARKRDGELGLPSMPHVPKAVNTLRAAVATGVLNRLGEAISQLGSAAMAADQLLSQQAELGEAAAGVEVPDPAAIRQARSLLEELVDG